MDKSKKLLELMKIPFIQADGEAEHYCSQLSHNNMVDYCLTDDMDVFPCGALKVIRSFKFNDNFVYIYNYDNFINKLGINSKKFIELSVLFGCDYIDIKFKKDLSDLEIYKLVKENDIKYILDNHCRGKITLEEFKFDIIKKKQLNNMLKINYLTKNDIELVESFFKNNNEKISDYKLNSLYKYCKNNTRQRGRFNNFRQNYRQGYNNYRLEY